MLVEHPINVNYTRCCNRPTPNNWIRLNKSVTFEAALIYREIKLIFLSKSGCHKVLWSEKWIDKNEYKSKLSCFISYAKYFCACVLLITASWILLFQSRCPILIQIILAITKTTGCFKRNTFVESNSIY